MSLPTVHLPPKVEQSGNVRVITFSTEEVRDVENVIARELEGCTDGLGRSHLLLDFTNVEYLSSVELGTLITLHKRMRDSGGRLTLFNLNPQVYEVFTITHLQTLLGICREGTTAAAGSSSTKTFIANKVDGSEKRGTGYPGDPDNKYVYVRDADPDRFVCRE
jgi:anti-sigma B factor antagonist